MKGLNLTRYLIISGILFILTKNAHPVCNLVGFNTNNSGGWAEPNWVVMKEGVGVVGFGFCNAYLLGFECNEGVNRIEVEISKSLYFPLITRSFSYTRPTWKARLLDGGANWIIRFYDPDNSSPIPCIYAEKCNTEYEFFIVTLTGPDGGRFPSAANDVTDDWAARRAYGVSGAQCSVVAASTSWPRRAFDHSILTYISPLSMGPEDVFEYEVRVANRSTSFQSGITGGTPSFCPDLWDDVQCARVTMISSPGTIDLSPDSAGSFKWVYKVDNRRGFLYFRSEAYNSSNTGRPTKSNYALAGILTGYTFATTSPVESGTTTEIILNVYKNYPSDPSSPWRLAIGDVFPNMSMQGNADYSFLSGPEPASYPAIPTGGAGGFRWNVLMSGSEGSYMIFVPSATAYSPSITSTYSKGLSVTVFDPPPPPCVDKEPFFLLSPEVFQSGSSNVEVTYDLIAGEAPIYSFTILFNPEFSYAGGATGGYNPDFPWNITEYSGGVTFTAPDGEEIFPCDRGKFKVKYNIPSGDPIETMFAFRAIADDSELPAQFVWVSPNKLNLSISSPAGPYYADGDSEIEISATFNPPLSGRNIIFFTDCGVLKKHIASTDSSGTAKTTLVSPYSVNPISCTVRAFYGLPFNWAEPYAPYGMKRSPLPYYDELKIDFLPYTGKNLLYVGGTMIPYSVPKGANVAFQIDVRNVGDAPADLTSSTWFSFTDGSNSYLSYLTTPVSVQPGERKTLYFSSEQVPSSFVTGLYQPSFQYNPVRKVWDNVEVVEPTGIEVLYFIAELIESSIIIRWSVISGEIRGFNIWREDISGGYIKVNNEPIPSFNGLIEYTYNDAYIPVDGYVSYLLEVIHRNGESSYYGPYRFTFTDGDYGREAWMIINKERPKEGKRSFSISCAYKSGSHHLYIFLILLYIPAMRMIYSQKCRSPF